MTDTHSLADMLGEILDDFAAHWVTRTWLTHELDRRIRLRTDDAIAALESSGRLVKRPITTTAGRPNSHKGTEFRSTRITQDGETP